MAQRFKAFLGIFLILSALAIYYSLAGASDPSIVTVYHIDATHPASSWMDVTITLHPPARPFIDLYLLDRRQLGKNRVRNIWAARGDRMALTWEPFPGRAEIQRVWTGFSTEPVTIRYQAHGQWRKNGNRMISYLGPEYGYLRGAVFLYTPVTIEEILKTGRAPTGDEIGRSTVAFDLPPGWQVVTPLDIEKLEVQTSVLRDVYFTIGLFGIEETQLGSDTVKIGIWQGLPAADRQRLRAALPLLYENTRSAVGFSNAANTCFRALTVLPAEPIYGSVAGEGSLVVESKIESIANGMFHWWIGSTLSTAPDAGWLVDGFSAYYQARLLYQSGLWSEEAFLAAIQDYQQRLWHGAAPQPVNLVQAAQTAAEMEGTEETTLVIYGGALLAYQIDRSLQSQGSSLDRLWPVLAEREQPLDTQAILDALQTLGGSDLRARTQAILNGQAVLEITD